MEKIEKMTLFAVVVYHLAIMCKNNDMVLQEYNTKSLKLQLVSLIKVTFCHLLRLSLFKDSIT